MFWRLIELFLIAIPSIVVAGGVFWTAFQVRNTAKNADEKADENKQEIESVKTDTEEILALLEGNNLRKDGGLVDEIDELQKIKSLVEENREICQDNNDTLHDVVDFLDSEHGVDIEHSDD